jgi:uncharacterized membrane protein
MSQIVDTITPNCLLLLNESFAATNEREGSEIARQIITALLEKGIKVFFVTHLYELARGFGRRNRWMAFAGHTPFYTSGTSPAQHSALEILRQRYARGEIDATTYEQMRERLEASGRPDQH